jgi:hypothetical protein
MVCLYFHGLPFAWGFQAVRWNDPALAIQTACRSRQLEVSQTSNAATSQIGSAAVTRSGRRV